MNHIQRLQAERDELRADLNALSGELTDLLLYLASSKFAAPDADYIHVSTDLTPRLRTLRARADRWRNGEAA